MSTEECESAVLAFLSTDEAACIADTHPWAQANHFDPLVVLGAVNSLLSEGYLAATDLATSFYTLSTEAQTILENGSQEMLVLKAIHQAGKLSVPDLEAAVGKEICKIGMGNCMKSKWISRESGDLVPLKLVEEVEDTVQMALKTLTENGCSPECIDDKVSKPLHVRRVVTAGTLAARSDLVSANTRALLQ